MREVRAARAKVDQARRIEALERRVAALERLVAQLLKVGGSDDA